MFGLCATRFLIRYSVKPLSTRGSEGSPVAAVDRALSPPFDNFDDNRRITASSGGHGEYPEAGLVVYICPPVSLYVLRVCLLVRL